VGKDAAAELAGTVSMQPGETYFIESVNYQRAGGATVTLSKGSVSEGGAAANGGVKAKLHDRAGGDRAAMLQYANEHGPWTEKQIRGKGVTSQQVLESHNARKTHLRDGLPPPGASGSGANSVSSSWDRDTFYRITGETKEGNQRADSNGSGKADLVQTSGGLESLWTLSGSSSSPGGGGGGGGGGKGLPSLSELNNRIVNDLDTTMTGLAAKYVVSLSSSLFALN
jgi:hypothetical protein